jgi:putative membrane protein
MIGVVAELETRRAAHPWEPIVLALLFWLLVGWSAIRPYDPKDYLFEIITPVGGFLLLVLTCRRFRFTGLAYRLMFLEAVILIVGAHYTHARVPLFDWIRDVSGGTRNDFDRLAHFCVGLSIVIPVREILRQRTALSGRWLGALAALSILGFAAFYEITEWWLAVAVAPDTAEAYLGSQGDPWDAQKDMLLDGVGAIVGLLAFARAHERQIERIGSR